ncbi:MAG TPA: hypothetical protein VMV72_12210 [Verrucomicrobiae bacterium]|nr:hypothetical protein [Verrucomicrobiae bacterium]
MPDEDNPFHDEQDPKSEEEVVHGGRLTKQLAMHMDQIGAESLQYFVNAEGDDFLVTVSEKKSPFTPERSGPDEIGERLSRQLALHLVTMRAAALQHTVTVHGKEYFVSAKYAHGPGVEEAA